MLRFLRDVSVQDDYNYYHENNYMDRYKKVKLNIFIIAEIGINHNGNINIVKQLIDVARDAGSRCGQIPEKNYRYCIF